MRRDIIIVGSGLNGPALGLALAQSGFSVQILDAAPKAGFEDPQFDGRSYAVALASQRLLGAIGIWPEIAELAEPILDIVVSDGRAGEGVSPLYVHFDHRELEEGPFGALMEDRYLRAALLTAAEAHPGIALRYDARVVAQDSGPGEVTVTLEDGETLSAAVLVGCDGRQSGTATRAGIRRVGWDYDQTSLVCAIEHERPHHGTAHQIFLPPGPLAILPLRGNRSSIVWTESRQRSAAIDALDDAGYLAELRPRFGDFLGEFRLAGKRYSYPLNLSLATRYVVPRVALVGDAAHGIHPIAGQGLNLGFRDIAAFAQVLHEARRRGEDIGSEDVLRRYQEWRRFDTAVLAAATDGINRLFSNDLGPLRALRDLGLGAVDRLPGLRRGFMRGAAGLSGEVPRLMTGQPL